MHGRHAGPVDKTSLNQSLILLLKREVFAHRINDQAHAAQHANAPAEQMALHQAPQRSRRQSLLEEGVVRSGSRGSQPFQR